MWHGYCISFQFSTLLFALFWVFFSLFFYFYNINVGSLIVTPSASPAGNSGVHWCGVTGQAMVVGGVNTGSGTFTGNRMLHF